VDAASNRNEYLESFWGKGLAMGATTSAILAEIFIQHTEHKVISNYKNTRNNSIL
jgi:hypothetical protein